MDAIHAVSSILFDRILGHEALVCQLQSMRIIKMTTVASVSSSLLVLELGRSDSQEPILCRNAQVE